MHESGKGLSPEEILVVAFNRVIARDLRRNVEEELRKLGFDSSPRISTIHALCNSMAPDERRMILPSEREAMLYDIRTQYPDRFRVFNFGQLSQMLNDHEAGHAQHPDLMAAVRRWLTAHRARLVSDLPKDTLDRIHGGDLPDLRFAEVVVDEFQDLTPVEQELVSRLIAPGGTLVALGDPNQSIYAFRGNDREGLDRLEELTQRPVHDLSMQECQRCPSAIVDAVNELLVLDSVPMISASAVEANVHVVHWASPDDEAKGMARHIVDNWRAFSGENHLVMVSRRKIGYALRDAIRELDPTIDINLTFSESLLEKWQARDAFLFFGLLADLDPCTVRAWLSLKPDAGQAQVKASERNAGAYLKLLAECDDAVIRVDDLRRLAAESRTRARGAGGMSIWDRATRFFEFMEKCPWSAMTADDVVREVFSPELWSVAEAEMDSVGQDILLMRDQAIQTLSEIRADGSTRSTEDELRQVAQDLRYRVAVREPFGTSEEGRIEVTTFWGSKGLTATHVYVLGLCDEAVPGTRTDEYPGTEVEYEDEQRRLFFVALTRTKRTLVLSQLKKVKRSIGLQMGLQMPHGQAWREVDLSTCRFLRTVQPHLPSSVRGPAWEGCVG
jgi:superfamily I DNA/RNA helicase